MKEVLRHNVEIVEEFPGSQLVGRSYEPLFPDAVPRGDSDTAWTVLSADWVTTTDGTGVVHTAVMYGCLLYTSPSPRDDQTSRMPSSA